MSPPSRRAADSCEFRPGDFSPVTPPRTPRSARAASWKSPHPGGLRPDRRCPGDWRHPVILGRLPPSEGGQRLARHVQAPRRGRRVPSLPHGRQGRTGPRPARSPRSPPCRLLGEVRPRGPAGLGDVPRRPLAAWRGSPVRADRPQRQRATATARTPAGGVGRRGARRRRLRCRQFSGVAGWSGVFSQSSWRSSGVSVRPKRVSSGQPCSSHQRRAIVISSQRRRGPHWRTASGASHAS